MSILFVDEAFHLLATDKEQTLLFNARFDDNRVDKMQPLKGSWFDLTLEQQNISFTNFDSKYDKDIKGVLQKFKINKLKMFATNSYVMNNID